MAATSPAFERGEEGGTKRSSTSVTVTEPQTGPTELSNGVPVGNLEAPKSDEIDFFMVEVVGHHAPAAVVGVGVLRQLASVENPRGRHGDAVAVDVGVEPVGGRAAGGAEEDVDRFRDGGGGKRCEGDGRGAADGGGDGRLDHLVLRDIASRSESTVDARSLFILIGAEPHTEWLPADIERDERGFILTGADISQSSAPRFNRSPFLLETSMPGVFAAGDVRHGSVKRVASAVGEGSIAIQLLHQYFAVEQLSLYGSSNDPTSADG